MYVDSTITLDSSQLPQMLKEDFSDLQRYYDAGDWFNFAITLENSVPSIKAFFANGTIDGEMFKLIQRKFGIA